MTEHDPMPGPRIDDHYADLADDWAEFAAGPWHTDVLWPALNGMLPDLSGKRVLDAGCGVGVYTQKLADRGSDTIGVDFSEEMLGEARERVPEATFERADLAEGLPFGTNSFDVVLCQHVLSHLEDVTVPFEAFARILAPDGVLVLSTHNPVHDYLIVREGEYPDTPDAAGAKPNIVNVPPEPDYTDTERYDIGWGDDGAINRATYYRHPVEHLFGSLCAAGFVIEDVMEPTADGAASVERAREDPPSSLCLRARH